MARTLVCPQVRLNIGHQGGSLGIKCKKDKNNDLVVTKIIDDGPAYLEGSLQVGTGCDIVGIICMLRNVLFKKNVYT